jgi:putative glutamine amidotransferase
MGNADGRSDLALVGITTYLEPAQFGVWRTECAVLPAAYVRAVRSAGARPVLIPPDPAGSARLVESIDGLVLTGGGDIDPSRFGADRHELTDQVDQDRDAGEAGLLEAALEARLPILGICRGMQLINILYGGDLVQHVPDVVGHDRHKIEPGVFHRHRVHAEPGTQLAALVGEETMLVESHHHQAVGRVGSGLIVSARAEDGLAEAIEDPERPFCLGVQWHPEEGDDNALFAGLIQCARSLVEVG